PRTRAAASGRRCAARAMRPACRSPTLPGRRLRADRSRRASAERPAAPWAPANANAPPGVCNPRRAGKRHSAAALLVGAVPERLLRSSGGTAATEHLDLPGVLLYAVMFL